MIAYFRNKKHRVMWRKAQAAYTIKSKEKALAKARALSLRKAMDRKIKKVPKVRFEAIELMSKKGDNIGAVILLALTVIPIAVTCVAERNIYDRGL